MGRARRGDPKCWFCGGRGHTQAECPEAAGVPAGDGEAPPRRRCFVCGSEAHKASECPEQAPAEDRPWPRVQRVVSGGSAGSVPAGGCGARMSVLITTSPVPSNPSTMMLEAVLNSFPRIEGLRDCPLVIVCDGYNICRKKSTWKAGQITEDAAERYAAYVKNLEALLESGRLPPSTRIVVLEGRNGQAFAVRAGLDQVETPFVCVHQHDLEFMFDFDLPRVLDALEDDSMPIKYVGLPLLVNLHYEAIAWQHHGVRVAEEAWGGLRLVPVVFWYDSTHITSVRQYRELVFGPAEPYRPGNFVEETFGVRQRQDIMSTGMAAHAKYGTYHCVSYGRDWLRRPLICHLNGVRFLTPEQRAERGYPPDPPVDFFASRTMLNRRQWKVKPLLDVIVGLCGMSKDDAAAIRNVLAKQLNDARLRSCNTATQSLPAALAVA